MKRIAITMAHMQATGQRYEDRYGGYLALFKEVSDAIDGGEEVMVTGAPWSWMPLLRYMGAEVVRPIAYFGAADNVAAAMLRHQPGPQVLTRSVVEALCALRPETVDALWKVDRQWKTQVRQPAMEREFIVTSNGSFDRPEIQLYERALAAFRPIKTKVVLVPCAADKPYPAEMHKAVLARMPDDFYLANITGVLGIVPMDLWPVMPHYDSGIPNEWRTMNVVKRYFGEHSHSHIVVYCDFYNMAIDAGLKLAGGYSHGEVDFVNAVQFYPDYLNLLDEGRLSDLEAAFKAAS